MRKMSFRATGSDAALRIRTQGKSKEIRIAAARLGYFVRIIVDDVSLPVSPFLSPSCPSFIGRAFSRHFSGETEERKAGKTS